MKTVYLFYISEEGYNKLNDWCGPDLIDPNPAVPRDWELYAMTTVPSYAKIFRKTRNPAYFRERKIHIKDEDYQEFTVKYSDYLLSKYPIRYDNKQPDKQGYIAVVLPAFEYRHLTDDWYLLFGSIISDEAYEKSRHIFEMLMADIKILNPIFRYALDTIFYTTILFDNDVPIEPETAPEENLFNALHGYYTLYNCTYRRKGIMKLCEYGNII